MFALPRVRQTYQAECLFIQLRPSGDPANSSTVETAWRKLEFPLIKTEDFDENWSITKGGWDIFRDENGQRCSITPRSKLASRYLDVEATSLYPSIVFSKILEVRSWTALYGKTLLIVENIVIRRRLFADKYLVHLPSDWRTAVLKYDLHHYDEKVKNVPRIPTGVHGPLSQPCNIRLLILLPCPPGADHLDIQCLLGEEKFGSCHPYEALSYFWGDAGIKKTIIVNTKQAEVTENLEIALRALRKSNGEMRILWIDALCINQSDDEEKKQQVAQMDEIYRRAKHVLIWLGGETISSQRVFNDLDQVKRDLGVSDSFPSWLPQHFPFAQEGHCDLCAKPPHEQDAAHDTIRNHPQLGEIYRQNGGSKLDQQLRTTVPIPKFLWDDHLLNSVEAFTQLLSRPWWKRIWVIQEFVLSSRAKILCGKRVADWVLFRGTLLTLVRVGQRSGLAYGLSNPTSKRQFQAFSQLVARTSEALPFFLMWGVNGHPDAAVKEFSPSLPNLLGLSLNTRATDPRDYIYALLGLLAKDSEDRKRIIPDYTKSAKEVYVNLARDYLRHSGTLNILSGVHSQAAVFSTLNLPSWVPDWSSRNELLPTYASISLTEFSAHLALSKLSQRFYTDISSKTAAAPDEQSKERISADEVFCATGSQVQSSLIEFDHHDGCEILRARGVLVDEVEAVGPALNPEHISLIMDITLEKLFAQTFDQWKLIGDPCETTSYMGTNQSRKEAFWRTILMDRHWESGGPAAQGRDVIKLLPADLKKTNLSEVFGSSIHRPATFPPETEDDEKLLRLYIHVSHNKRVSYNKLSCHCYSYAMFRTKLGYIGLCQPHVKQGDDVVILLGGMSPFVLRKYEKHHVLMGECYVHGIMQGEFLEHQHMSDLDAGDTYEAFDIM